MHFHPTPYLLHSILYTLSPTLYPLPLTPYSPSLAPHPLHLISYTLLPTPYSLHPIPYTMSPTPCPIHSIPYTSSPTPYPLHPMLYTLSNTHYSRCRRRQDAQDALQQAEVGDSSLEELPGPFPQERVQGLVLAEEPAPYLGASGARNNIMGVGARAAMLRDRPGRWGIW